MTTKKEKIAALLERHEVSDSELRALGGNASRALISAFETADGPDRDADRARVVRALGLLGTRGSVEFLIALVEDEDAPFGLRDAAVSALGTTNAPKAVRFLIARLASPDEMARRSAVYALIRSDHPKARAALERAAAGDPSDPVCHAACLALGHIEPDPDHTFLVEH